MSNEEMFDFNIANLKKDLAIEDIPVNEEDVELLKRYYNNEITLNEMIDMIKKSIT